MYLLTFVDYSLDSKEVLSSFEYSDSIAININTKHIMEDSFRPVFNIKYAIHFAYFQVWNYSLWISNLKLCKIDGIYFMLKAEGWPKTVPYDMSIYNAIKQNICFVKGSHKYDVYLHYKNKAHLNWPNIDRNSIFIEHNVISRVNDVNKRKLRDVIWCNVETTSCKQTTRRFQCSFTIKCIDKEEIPYDLFA